MKNYIDVPMINSKVVSSQKLSCDLPGLDLSLNEYRTSVPLLINLICSDQEALITGGWVDPTRRQHSYHRQIESGTDTSTTTVQVNYVAIVGKLKMVLTNRPPRYGSIINHIVTVQF